MWQAQISCEIPLNCLEVRQKETFWSLSCIQGRNNIVTASKATNHNMCWTMQSAKDSCQSAQELPIRSIFRQTVRWMFCSLWRKEPGQNATSCSINNNYWVGDDNELMKFFLFFIVCSVVIFGRNKICPKLQEYKIFSLRMRKYNVCHSVTHNEERNKL